MQRPGASDCGTTGFCCVQDKSVALGGRDSKTIRVENMLQICGIVNPAVATTGNCPKTASNPLDLPGQGNSHVQALGPKITLTKGYSSPTLLQRCVVCPDRAEIGMLLTSSIFCQALASCTCSCLWLRGSHVHQSEKFCYFGR